MKHIFYTFALVFFTVGCGNAPQPPIQLNDLSNDISVKKLGERLIDLPYGLNTLEANQDVAQEIFIAVHGAGSEGYEWIYPIKTIDSKQKHMYFYRWHDNWCFQSSAVELANEINNLLSQNNSFKKVSLIGHSYGGILVTHVLKLWNAATPLEVHVVASPLLGTSTLKSICGYEPIEMLPNNTSLFEWRTQHQLDSAFKYLSEDPQQINIKGSSVTVLPETYKGNRLGHNWSISWVADEAF
ncbi:triacylglycerol lipase [SAR86 cluster bacterium SAR86E]|uniref:Triacylglycerol lipase n=1 Tax=SAR86 cluster bacterium SAR86E TaxID=1208365 RepID=K6H310_9GAMM|nr:triacylglycerol lipase [SAR86 cluster bacterium SAR86E]